MLNKFLNFRLRRIEIQRCIASPVSSNCSSLQRICLSVQGQYFSERRSVFEGFPLASIPNLDCSSHKNCIAITENHFNKSVPLIKVIYNKNPSKFGVPWKDTHSIWRFYPSRGFPFSAISEAHWCYLLWNGFVLLTYLSP